MKEDFLYMTGENIAIDKDGTVVAIEPDIASAITTVGGIAKHTPSQIFKLYIDEHGLSKDEVKERFESFLDISFEDYLMGEPRQRLVITNTAEAQTVDWLSGLGVPVEVMA